MFALKSHLLYFNIQYIYLIKILQKSLHQNTTIWGFIDLSVEDDLTRVTYCGF